MDAGRSSTGYVHGTVTLARSSPPSRLRSETAAHCFDSPRNTLRTDYPFIIVASSPQRSSTMQLKDSRLFRQQCYIDGAWHDAASGATADVINPATQDKLGTVPNMGAKET